MPMKMKMGILKLSHSEALSRRLLSGTSRHSFLQCRKGERQGSHSLEVVFGLFRL